MMIQLIGPGGEEAVIRERFDRYIGLPAVKIETMRPVSEAAVAIHARLAMDAPEVLPAGCALEPPITAPS